MPNNFSPQDIQDIFLNTLESPLDRDKYADISFTRQNNMVRRFMDDKGKVPEKSGTELTFQAMVDHSSNAHVSGLYAQDRRGRKSMTEKASVPWCKVVDSGEYDIDEPVFQQGEDLEIVSFFKMLRHGVYSSLYTFMEELMFSMPSAITERPFPILGLPYWFPLDTTTDGDFKGMNPAGFSDVAGIDRTTRAGWRSFTFGWDAIDWTFVKQLQNAFLLTSFESPDPNWNAQLALTNKKDWFLATTLNVVNETSELLRTGNQDFGKDLGNFATAMINSRSLEYSAYMTETCTKDELYAINTRFTGWYGKTGGTMRESKPTMIPGASDMRMFRIAHWSQMCCVNSREGGFHAGAR